jgi:hypothetical protein
MMTIENEITRKANRNASYKAQLMSDPHALFLAEYGVEVPEDVRLQVVEQEGGIRVQLPSLERTRLSDRDVEVMAAFGTMDNMLAPDTSCTTWWTQTTDCG